MRNGGAATAGGEFPDADVEKQGRDGVEEKGGGLAENAAVGQSEDFVERIEVVVVDCPKAEPQLASDSNSHDECRYN